MQVGGDIAPPKQFQLHDIVYGTMTLPSYCLPFVNQPSMQRIKNISQLGPNYYVFPGATHNRFEHSCGVAYLCDMQMNAFRRHHEMHQVSALSSEEFPFNEQDHKCIVLAGLMHDLGHGIYSHLFDRNTMNYLLPNGLPPKPVGKRSRLMSDGSVGLDTLMDDISASITQGAPGRPWEHEDASAMLIDYTHD